MVMRRYLKKACLITAVFSALYSAAYADEEKSEDLPIPEAVSIVTEHKGTFSGTKMDYTATVSNLLLKNEEGDIYASAFTTAYIAKTPTKSRPVTFVFNGGPGSSSTWLHMGLVGPKRVVVPSDADDAGLAPYEMVENEFSILDLTDIVMIDPIGTGYSRLAGKGKPANVYGLEEDASTVAQVVREWVRKNNRWNAPKFIMGESFGTTRAAAMMPYLEAGPEAIRVNGLILISQALDYTGSTPAHNNLVAYVTYLPTMAATAWYHNKLVNRPENLESYLEEVRAFATKEYLPALFMGSGIDTATFDAVATKLAKYLGLEVDYVKRANLRVLGGRFVKELMRDKGLSTGRLDARYLTDEIDDTAETVDYDAGSAALSGAYSAAIHHYLRNDLNVNFEEPYYIYGPEVGKNWIWQGAGENHDEPVYVNSAPQLARAMRYNPSLKVMVASGYFDFATPFFDAEYTFNRHGIDMTRVTMTYYPAGHMMYVHQPSLEAVVVDIRAFYKNNPLSR
ncbi:S10 family peptidase [Kordiimonas pumila]|uniref:S10 family peptidase n=1 Tax=Kordiimonas pumila TaxID=2161677 RepID=A0ABV7D819_9PROT|nr:peptidase S10 [Kordiimonas pumila]